jgi:hypothetical protein
MAWLHDNGDENEYPQFDEDDSGEKDEGVLEETEEEVTITERPGMPEAPSSAPKPKPRKPSAARKSRRKPARAKARPKKKKKAAARSSKKKSARKSSRSRKRR